MKHADPHFNPSSLPEETFDSENFANVNAELNALMAELGAALQASLITTGDRSELRSILQKAQKMADAKMAESRQLEENTLNL